MLSYLTKRLVLEKGYAVWGTPAEDGSFTANGLSLEEMPAACHLCTFPELGALAADLDVILVRSDGLGFQIAGLRRPRAGEDPWVLRDRLLRVADACQRYTGSVEGTKILPEVTVWEVHERGLDAEASARLDIVKCGRRLSMLALDPATSEAWSNLPPVSRWFRARYARRLLRERGMSEEEMHALVALAGVRVVPIAIAVTGGFTLALGARHALARLEVEDGHVYSASDLLIGIAVTCFAVLARRIRRRSTAQAAIAASAYGVLLFGGMILLGTEPSFTMAINLAVMVGVAVMVGSVFEMT